jgi:hypothetical protein
MAKWGGNKRLKKNGKINKNSKEQKIKIWSYIIWLLK